MLSAVIKFKQWLLCTGKISARENGPDIAWKCRLIATGTDN